jgi:hypothetical protein
MGEALQALYGFTDVIATNCSGHDTLDICNIETVTSRDIPVDINVDIASAIESFAKAEDTPVTFLTARSMSPVIRSISFKLVPATFTPTGLLIPVASMSIRFRIGGTQILTDQEL